MGDSSCLAYDLLLDMRTLGIQAYGPDFIFMPFPSLRWRSVHMCDACSFSSPQVLVAHTTFMWKVERVCGKEVALLWATESSSV